MKNKKNNWIQSFKDLSVKYGKAAGIIVTVAGIFFTIGYKCAEVFKEREIMKIENAYSTELLNLKEEYMEKYFQLREQQLVTNQNDSTNGNKGK